MIGKIGGVETQVEPEEQTELFQEAQVEGQDQETTGRRRPPLFIWIYGNSDPGKLVSMALTRLTRFQRVAMRSAGTANEIALRVLASVLTEYGRVRWLASGLGGQVPGVRATVEVKLLDDGRRAPVPAMDIVIQLEE